MKVSLEASITRFSYSKIEKISQKSRKLQKLSTQCLNMFRNFVLQKYEMQLA